MISGSCKYCDNFKNVNGHKLCSIFYKDCEFEPAKVKYIVHLKDGFKMPNTTINREFCGSYVKWLGDRIVFDLNSNYDAQVIIPIDAIDWMAPSKVMWDNLYTEIEKECAEELDND